MAHRSQAHRSPAHTALLVSLGGCLLLPVSLLRGHPQIEAAMRRLDARIVDTPADAELHLRRGELHASHRDFDLAARDFARAEFLMPLLPGLESARASVLLERNRPEDARAVLDRALTRNPADAEALVLRARALAQIGDHAGARADYAAACEILLEPPPDLFLAQANLCVEDADALRVLDRAIERIGPAIALQTEALNLEIRLSHTNAALCRLETITAASERKESWLKMRGDVLARAGRNDEAYAAYAAAVAEIHTLPAALRDGQDTAALAQDLLRLLGAIEPATSTPGPDHTSLASPSAVSS